MIRSHHIATALVAEHQRELRASARRGWRVPLLFARRKAELPPVPPAQASRAGGDGQGRAGAAPARLLPAASQRPLRRRISANRRTASAARADKERVGV